MSILTQSNWADNFKWNGIFLHVMKPYSISKLSSRAWQKPSVELLLSTSKHLPHETSRMGRPSSQEIH